MISLLKITRPPRARRLPLARGGSLAAWAKCCACSGAPSRVVAVDRTGHRDLPRLGAEHGKPFNQGAVVASVVGHVTMHQPP
jgi:hypothetical protein